MPRGKATTILAEIDGVVGCDTGTDRRVWWRKIEANSVFGAITERVGSPRTEANTKETRQRDNAEVRAGENWNMEESLVLLSTADSSSPPIDFGELKL